MEGQTVIVKLNKTLEALSLVLLTIVLSFGANSAHAQKKTKKGIKITDQSRFSTIQYTGGTVSCFLNNKGVWQSGRINKKGTLFKIDNKKKTLKNLRLKVKNAENAKKKKKAKNALAKKRSDFTARTTACQGDNSGGGGGGGGGAPPPQGPDALSLAPLDRALTSTDIIYLLEKAGYGGDDATLQGLAPSGVQAVIDNLMSIKAEDSVVNVGGVNKRTSDWVEDFLDDNLGNEIPGPPPGGTSGVYDDPLIPTMDGMRKALIFWTLNTKNPVRLRLLHMYMRVFSVNACRLDNGGENAPGGTDPRQSGIYWAYIQQLDAASKSPNLISLIQNVGRSVAMLVSHGNDGNDKDDPSELYAQELLDRFTIGVQRTDDAGAILFNYSRNTVDGAGDRNDDLAIIARRLTGHAASLEAGPNGSSWQQTFTPAAHADGPETVFPGRAWAFTPDESLNGLFTDNDLVEQLMVRHPGSAENWSRIILEEFLTPDPPQELVKEFAALIAASNYNIEGPLRTLLMSKAFFFQGYRDTIAKNPLEYIVGAAKTLSLAPLTNLQDIDILMQDITNSAKSARSTEIGMNFDFLCPSSPHFYPRERFLEAGALMMNFQMAARMVERALDHQDSLAGTKVWTVDTVLPVGAISADALINNIANRVGVSVAAPQKTLLELFMNIVINDNPEGYVPYDNTDDGDRTIHRNGKGMALWTILLGYPGFSLR